MKNGCEVRHPPVAIHSPDVPSDPSRVSRSTSVDEIVPSDLRWGACPAAQDEPDRFGGAPVSGFDPGSYLGIGWVRLLGIWITFRSGRRVSMVWPSGVQRSSKPRSWMVLWWKEQARQGCVRQ